MVARCACRRDLETPGPPDALWLYAVPPPCPPVTHPEVPCVVTRAAFLTSGSSAGYMFAYSIFYFYTKLEITKFVSALLYFGYMWVSALIFFLLTGTIGFYACYWFVFKIFSAIKVD